MKKNFLIKIITILSAIVMIAGIAYLIGTASCGGIGKDADDPVVYPTLQRTQPTEATRQTEQGKTQEPTQAPYVSPIDWADLAEKNPDIYAWIYIPDTEISYPVVQSPDDDYYYLDHSAYRREYSGGAIFSEHKYNTKTFEDPVTILYGHKMRSGAMLGTMQTTFASEEGFNSHREVIIYMPECELHYKVWAATPFESYHIIDSFNGFEDARDVHSFIRSLTLKRNMEKQMDYTMEISDSDRLLVLSTCLMGRVSQRYLLIGRLESVIK